MLIANRNGMAVGKAWTNPYVTDGLIAMWDGQWNVAGGQHDSTATTWADISGNSRDAVLSGTYSWGSNYWHVESKSNRGLATWPAQDLGSNQTVEFVCKVYDGVNYGRYIAEAQGVAAPCINTGTSTIAYLYMFGYGTDRSLSVSYNPYNNIVAHQYTHLSGSTLDYYLNGTRVVNAMSGFPNDSTGATSGYFANNTSYARGINADYFCVRRYNRVLTTAEISSNYAVDKARFNLP